MEEAKERGSDKFRSKMRGKELDRKE